MRHAPPPFISSLPVRAMAGPALTPPRTKAGVGAFTVPSASSHGHTGTVFILNPFHGLYSSLCQAHFLKTAAAEVYQGVGANPVRRGCRAPVSSANPCYIVISPVRLRQQQLVTPIYINVYSTTAKSDYFSQHRQQTQAFFTFNYFLQHSSKHLMIQSLTTP